MKSVLLLVLSFFVFQPAIAQVVTNKEKSQQLSNEYYRKSHNQKIVAKEFLRPKEPG